MGRNSERKYRRPPVVFSEGEQMQAVTNRDGITRSEVYECIVCNPEKNTVRIVNDAGREAEYRSSYFRRMHDDFASMFGISAGGEEDHS